MGTKMFFIQEGIVDIVTSDGEVATSLSDGSYFGGNHRNPLPFTENALRFINIFVKQNSIHTWSVSLNTINVVGVNISNVTLMLIFSKSRHNLRFN